MRLLRILFAFVFILLTIFPAQAQDCDASAATDTPAALVERSRACNVAENYDQALADLNRALTLDPNYAPAAYNRAITYMNRNNFERALVDLQYALDLRYDNPQHAYTLMGWSHVNLEHYEDAVAAFEQAIAMDPNDDFAYWGLGDSYRGLGEFDQALENYHRHLDLAGEDASPSVQGWVWGFEGESVPTSLTPARTNWEILGAFLLAIIGVAVRFRFASNIWRRNMERPKKPKAQQVYEQTRDLEKAQKREKQPVETAPVQVGIKVKQHHVDNLSVLTTLNRPNMLLNQAPPAEIGSAGVGGASPEVVNYVWQTLAKLLPKDCNWMVYGRVALVHPEVGLVFCVALGSGLVVMRLPDAERKVAIAASPNSITYELGGGKTINAMRFGPDWVFVGKNAHKWVRAAYDYTGKQGRREIKREDYY